MSKTIRFVLVFALVLGVTFSAVNTHVFAVSPAKLIYRGEDFPPEESTCSGAMTSYLNSAGQIVLCPVIVTVPQGAFSAGSTFKAMVLTLLELGAPPSKHTGAHVWLSLGVNLKFTPSKPYFTPAAQVCFPAPPAGWNSMIRWQVTTDVGPEALVGKWLPLSTYNSSYGSQALRCANVNYEGNYALSGNYTGK